MFIHENIGRFDVTMNNLPIPFPPTMTIVKCLYQLVKDLPYGLFREVVLGLLAGFQQWTQITPCTVLHYDIDCRILLIHDAIVVLHNVWMVQRFQQIHLCDELLFLATVHRAITHFFPHQHATVRQTAYLLDNSEGTFADNLHLLVFLHSNLQLCYVYANIICYYYTMYVARITSCPWSTYWNRPQGAIG